MTKFESFIVLKMHVYCCFKLIKGQESSMYKENHQTVESRSQNHEPNNWRKWIRY